VNHIDDKSEIPAVLSPFCNPILVFVGFVQYLKVMQLRCWRDDDDKFDDDDDDDDDDDE